MELEVLLRTRQEAEALAEELDPADFHWLIGLLGEKNNEIRYAAFLLLAQRSRTHGDIYPLWDTLAEKLNSGNSYQRSIGVMLLCENVRWDRENRLQAIWPRYAACFRDEKFITARQAIQSLKVWLAQRPDMHEAVYGALTAIQPASLPGTQRKLILADIIEALLLMRETAQDGKAAAYLMQALDSGLLDKKEREALRKRLGIV